MNAAEAAQASEIWQSHAAILLPLLITIVGGLIVMLSAIAAWLGRAIYHEVISIRLTVQGIEKDLRGELARLDRRTVRLEVLKDVLVKPGGNCTKGTPQ